MKNVKFCLFFALTFLTGWNMQASFMKGNNKHEVLATSENEQVYVTTADKIYHVHGSLLVVDEKITQAQQGKLTPQERAALPLWIVKYSNKTLLHVGQKTQRQCDQDLKSVTNEMAYSFLGRCCGCASRAQLVRKEMEDYLAELHQS